MRDSMLLMLLSALVASCSAFVVVNSSIASLSTSHVTCRCQRACRMPASLLRAAESGEDMPAAPEPVAVADEEEKQETKVVPMDMSLPTINLDQQKEASYPIDFPAYGLLSLSTVVAIAFVGSIFEVAGPQPLLGYVPTYIIGTLSLPGFLFLFYAAIKKGQAEAEEDDEDFYK